MARLAGGIGDEYFLDQFFIYVDKDNVMKAMTKEELAGLSIYLKWLAKDIEKEIETNADAEELQEFIEKLNERIE